jgi:hypothetical protein
MCIVTVTLNRTVFSYIAPYLYTHSSYYIVNVGRMKVEQAFYLLSLARPWTWRKMPIREQSRERDNHLGVYAC